jgi:hypothetical protein
MNVPTVPQAVQSCHELLLWLIPHLDKFPRARRFTLGERIETGLSWPQSTFDLLRTNIYISEIIMFSRSC